jgi:phosphopantetheine adenylyltransferase
LLYELVEPVHLRLEKVEEFLQEIAPPMTFRVVPISDPFGPTITEKNVDLIVVSQETVRGANKINEIREQKNYPPLVVHAIDLVSEPNKESEHEEDKISSSSKRLRILGERLRPSVINLELFWVSL